MTELEKAQLLSVAVKIIESKIDSVRQELSDQLKQFQSTLDSISSSDFTQLTESRDGRGISDIKIIDDRLVVQLTDGTIVSPGNIIGEQGPIGITGQSGIDGRDGDTGQKGDIGEKGDQGDRGDIGEKGDKGDKGDTGNVGDQGDKGDIGEKGNKGTTGQKGDKGDTGLKGDQGIQGIQGDKGADGKNGSRGEKGTKGDSGSAGLKGDRGESGLKGDAGEKGNKGDTGSDADVGQLKKDIDQYNEGIEKRLSRIAYNVTVAGGNSPGSGEVLLHNLDDVDYNSVKSPSDGQSLVFKSSLGKWQANTVSGGGGGLSNTFTTTVATQHLVPTANNTYNLGSSTKRYNQLWLAGSTINLGNTTLKSSASGTLRTQGLSGTVQTIVANSYLSSTFIANTAARSLISDRVQVANAVATYQTRAVERAALANTNIYVATQSTRVTLVNTNLINTNTAIRTLVSDRLQVSNAATIYQTRAIERAALANTNTYIATKLNSSSYTTTDVQSKAALANTNARISLVNTNLTSTNNAVRLLISDRLQVANAATTYQTRAIERAALANTNASIATQATRVTLVNTNLTGTNTAIRTLVSDRLQVANAAAIYQTKAIERAALANTNSYIATKLNSSSYTTADVQSKAALANTNASIATQATRVTLVNTNLINTNTAIRTLVSDRLQVANAAAIYQTKAIERAALANTNVYIATQASRITLVNTNLTGTNTAVRTLVSDRLQVSNASAIYQTKVVERAALANTNSYIATQATRVTLVNTNLTNTNTAVRVLIADRLQVANATTIYTTKPTIRSGNTSGVTTILNTLTVGSSIVANPSGHLVFVINGTSYKVPYFT